MIQAGNELDALMPDFRPTAQWNRVHKIAGELTKRLEASFHSMSPTQKMMSEVAYDLAHRIAYYKAADMDEPLPARLV